MSITDIDIQYEDGRLWLEGRFKNRGTYYSLAKNRHMPNRRRLSIERNPTLSKAWF